MVFDQVACIEAGFQASRGAVADRLLGWDPDALAGLRVGHVVAIALVGGKSSEAAELDGAGVADVFGDQVDEALDEEASGAGGQAEFFGQVVGEFLLGSAAGVAHSWAVQEAVGLSSDSVGCR